MLFKFFVPVGIDYSRWDNVLTNELVPYLTMFLCLKAACDRWGNPCRLDRPKGTKYFSNFLSHLYLTAMTCFSAFYTGTMLFVVLWEAVLTEGKNGFKIDPLYKPGGFGSHKKFGDSLEAFTIAAKVALYAETFFFIWISNGGINDVTLLDHFRTVWTPIAYSAALTAKADWMWAVVLVEGLRNFLGYASRMNAAAAAAGSDTLAGTFLRVPEPLMGAMKEITARTADLNNETLLNVLSAGVMLAMWGGKGTPVDCWLQVFMLVGLNLFFSVEREFPKFWNKMWGSKNRSQ